MVDCIAFVSSCLRPRISYSLHPVGARPGPALLDIKPSTYRVRRPFPQLGEKQLLARQPSAYFNTRTLLPIYHGAVTGAVDSVRLYMQAILDRPGNGIFGQFYTQSCFNAAFLKRLLQPASWRMEDYFDPLDSDSTSFHIYNFFSCL